VRDLVKEYGLSNCILLFQTSILVNQFTMVIIVIDQMRIDIKKVRFRLEGKHAKIVVLGRFHRDRLVEGYAVMTMEPIMIKNRRVNEVGINVDHFRRTMILEA